MKKRRLFTPGPTPLIPAAQQAMAAPVVHHRTDEFKAQLKRVSGQLQQLFATTEPVLILTSSGTGAMEAAVCALARRDGMALAVTAGKFGERWAEIAQRHAFPCTVLTREYGQTASADEVAKAAVDSEADLVLLQGCETSTGTSFDLEGIARETRRQRPDALLVVDAITAIGSQRLQMDDWGLDLVLSGSQKGFATPPGLSFVALGSRARQRLQSSPEGSYYLDLHREWSGQQQGRTAFTPAVSLVAALEAAAGEILSQGLEAVIDDAARMAAATRTGLQALGFRLLSERPANAVTAVYPPDGIDSEALRRHLDQHFGLKVAGGQGPLKGRIIRIAHLGYFDRLDVVTVLSAVELSLAGLNGTAVDGRGVGAALQALHESPSTVGAP